MIYWIFDMDETLYRANGKFSYNSLKADQELFNLIKKLNGLKILFTNGTHQHTNIVLKNLGLVSTFDLILDRNILQGLKPNPQVFYKLVKWCSITPNDKCFFFEDSVHNLIVGYSLGWQTILIDDNHNPNNHNNSLNKVLEIDVSENGNIVKKYATIHYTFKNIKDALRHFLARMP